MNQSPPKQYVSLHVRLDPLTRARIGHLQRITNRSLPKLLQAVFKNLENNHVLPRLDATAREAYFSGKLGFEEYKASPDPSIREEEDRATEREVFDAADSNSTLGATLKADETKGAR
jgi:hypothetical protein